MFIFTLKETLNYCIEFLWINSVLLENFQQNKKTNTFVNV